VNNIDEIFNNKGKMLIRSVILNYAIEKGGKCGELLGGGQFKEMSKSLITCVSIDHGGSFDNAERLKRKYKKDENVHITSLKKFVKKTDEKLEMVWHDPCGPMSEGRMGDEMDQWISIMAERGIFALTTRIGRENHIGLKKGTSRQVIDARIEKILNRIFKRNNLFVDKIFDYKYESCANHKGKKKNITIWMRAQAWKITKLN
jgi:hypothetical protein